MKPMITTFNHLPIGSVFTWDVVPCDRSGQPLAGPFIKTGPLSFRSAEDPSDYVWQMRPGEFHATAVVTVAVEEKEGK